MDRGTARSLCLVLHPTGGTPCGQREPDGEDVREADRDPPRCRRRGSPAQRGVRRPPGTDRASAAVRCLSLAALVRGSADWAALALRGSASGCTGGRGGEARGAEGGDLIGPAAATDRGPSERG